MDSGQSHCGRSHANANGCESCVFFPPQTDPVLRQAIDLHGVSIIKWIRYDDMRCDLCGQFTLYCVRLLILLKCAGGIRGPW